MAQYVAAYKGYIADVPRVWFKRCDGHMFYFDEITQASATPQTNTIEINAGWQLFPVAVLPGQSTFELSLTSGQFNSELFALAANRSFAADTTYKTWFTETVTFSNAGVATLSYACAVDSSSKPIFWFNGIDDNDTVSLSGTGTGANKTVTVTIVPNTGETGSNAPLTGEVEVMYMTAIGETNPATVLYSSNNESAIGEAYMRWPVYSANDDCTDSAIKGYVELHIFRCRVTQGPGFDTSYKSAATNQCVFSAVDAKRADDMVYSIAYFELPALESQQGG